MRRSAVWIVMILAISAASVTAASVQPANQGIEQLVTSFVAALDARNGNALALLFLEAPSSLCNDLDILIYNEVLQTQLTTEPMRLIELILSEASIREAPGAAPLRTGQFAVRWGLDWRYQLPDDNVRSSRLDIAWTVEVRRGSTKVVSHTSKDIDEESECR